MSTEHTLGHFGKKTSRVLKPPGGGSSDIFGTGTASASCESSVSENHPLQPDNTCVKSRVFGVPAERVVGASADSPTTPQKMNTAAMFEKYPNPTVVSVTKKKKYVPRNPITGEGMDASGKQESPEKENEEKIEKDEDKKEEVQQVPVTTSIRVCNPPGGKSSGIF